MLSWVPAVVGPDRAAVEQGLIPTALDAFTVSEAEFAGNYFFGEVTFADKQRHDKGPWCEHTPQHAGEIRFLFPECLNHLREDLSPTQFLGVLIHR
jgi:hypothetical protein